VLERLAQKVVALEADEQRVEQPLRHANGQQPAPHVLEQQEPAAGPQHTAFLSDRGAVVGDRAEGERADDRVETLVGKLERLGVASAQIGVAAELARPRGRSRASPG